MSQDISVASTFKVPENSVISTKPFHLVILKDKIGVAKNNHHQCFVALDLPAMGNPSFVHAKGFFTEAAPEEVSAGYKEIILALDKTKITEEYFPWSDIKRITNLVFRHK